MKLGGKWDRLPACLFRTPDIGRIRKWDRLPACLFRTPDLGRIIRAISIIPI
jgi:hypothetical protein